MTVVNKLISYMETFVCNGLRSIMAEGRYARELCAGTIDPLFGKFVISSETAIANFTTVPAGVFNENVSRVGDHIIYSGFQFLLCQDGLLPLPHGQVLDDGNDSELNSSH